MTRIHHHRIFSWLYPMVLVLLSASTPVNAQDVTFESLVVAPDTSVLLPVQGYMLAGIYKEQDTTWNRTSGGGIVVWDLNDMGEYIRWTGGTQLTSNKVVDLTDSGRYVWAATDGGGLTRIENVGPDAEFRHFSTLGGLRLTSVAATIIQDNERVYYAIAGGGIGVVNNSFPGQVYTAELDGLIDNNVNDLMFRGEELFIATSVGISRFVDNVFTDQNTGLPDLAVNVLALDVDGSLLAGTTTGVSRWDDVNEVWEPLFEANAPIVSIAAIEEEIWTVGLASWGFGWVGRYDRTEWATANGPHSNTFPFRSCLAASEEGLFISGKYQSDQMDQDSYLMYLGQYAENQDGYWWNTWIIDAPLVLVAEGVTIDHNGTVWMGDHDHVSVSGYDGDQWNNIFELASIDSAGLWTHTGAVLSMATGPTGDVWFAQYGWGLGAGKIRFDPDADDGQPGDFWYSNNNFPELAGRGNSIVAVATHPDGPVIFMHDFWDEGLVEILIDPEHYRNPDSWIYPRDFVGSTLSGSNIWAALVARPDVIWFAVEDLGLVRWDINGLAAGPDSPLTWADPSDDDWQVALTSLSGSTFNPAHTRGMAVDANGSIWAAGGPGVARFTYIPSASGEGIVVDVVSFTENIGSGGQGLLASGVKDVVLDGNGDAWVTSDAGLNRIRVQEEGFTIDAYTDPVNFFNYAHFAGLYGPGIISDMPGGTYYKLATSLDGYQLVAGSDHGAVRFAVEPYEEQPDNVTEGLADLYLYPNPLTIDGSTMLKLGGISADPTADSPAKVEIFNLEGQLVYRNSYVADETAFWDGTNRTGNPVTTGLYQVRVELDGAVAVKTLAIVR